MGTSLAHVMDVVSDHGPPVVEATTPDLRPTGKEKSGALERGALAALGLRLWELGLVLAISTAAFLFWGGPLWSASPGDSHVWRIGGSYFIVIPLVLGALARRHRPALGHLVGSVGAIWGAKMLITATLYAGVAPSSATEYAPMRTWEVAEPGPAERDVRPNQAASIAQGSADIEGVVASEGVPAPSVAVLVDDVRATTILRPAARIPIAIEHSQYGQSVYVAAVTDHVTLVNRDASLHLLRMSQDHRAVSNTPVPPGAGERAIVTPPPGSYSLTCENHDSERAILVVVDHPYFSLTDENGRFRIAGVPAGEHTLVVMRNGHGPSRRTIALAPGTVLPLSIETR